MTSQLGSPESAMRAFLGSRSADLVEVNPDRQRWVWVWVGGGLGRLKRRAGWGRSVPALAMNGRRTRGSAT